MKIPNITDLTFSENAYFYHVRYGGKLSKNTVENICSDACKGKNAHWVGELRTYCQTQPSVQYSLKIFKTTVCPSFLKPIDEYWQEKKIGYILVLEYKDYVAIIKKNTASINTKGILEEIPYKTLLNIYMTPDTSISKMNMRNLDGSTYAMQSRILESHDLRQNLSAFGLNRYYLQSYNGENAANGRFSLAMGSSRINWHETGVNIDDVANWIVKVIDSLIAYATPADDFMSIFAIPESYKSAKDDLVPNSVLVYYNQLLRIIENSDVNIYGKDGNVISCDKNIAIKYIDRFASTLDIKVINKNGVDRYYIGTEKGLNICKEANSITLSSFALRRVEIINHLEPSYNGTLQRIINSNSLFNVYFTDKELFYSHRTLFRDHQLINSAPDLLQNMISIEELEDTHCEKIHDKQFSGVSQWAEDSIFKVVEDRFRPEFEHFVCDDYGDEWADHIGVSEGKVSFYCSKHNDKKKCSAAAFQDVIGQALKNLGNMTPSSHSLSAKIVYWNSNHTTSNLERYRSKTGTLQEMEKKWKNSISNPNTVREMCLVVDFISKDDFEYFVNKINQQSSTSYTKSAFQLLWLLSSFVASCKEVGVKPIVYCK